MTQRDDISAADGAPVATSQRVEFNASFHSGPLPSPRIMAAYEQILPGSADRILRMAESEGEHRRREEEKDNGSRRELALLNAQVVAKNTDRGQRYGFSILALVTLLGGGLLALGVKPEGVYTLSAGLALLLGAALWRRLDENKERKEQTRKELRSEELGRELKRLLETRRERERSLPDPESRHRESPKRNKAKGSRSPTTR